MTTKDNLPAIQKQVAPAIAKASSLVITKESMPEATALLSALNRASKALTEGKEKLTKPLNAALKEVRSRYKPAEDELDGAIAVLRRNIGAYQTEAQRITDIEAAKIADRVGEGRGKLKSETAAKKIAEIDAPAPSVVTEAGAVGFATVKKFEVVDFALLPDEYKVANEAAIRTAMRAGQEIPGVRYYDEQQVRNSR